MTGYLMHLHVKPHAEGALHAYLQGLDWRALGVRDPLVFQKGDELVLTFDGDGPRPWAHLFEGGAGHELEAQLRLHTSFEVTRPAAHVVADMREAATLPPEAQPSPDESFSGG